MNLIDKFVDYGWGVAYAMVSIIGAFIWDTRNKIVAHELHVSEHYVKKNEIKELENRIIERTDLILELIKANTTSKRK